MSIMKRSLTEADKGPFYDIRNKKPIGHFTIFIQEKYLPNHQKCKYLKITIESGYRKKNLKYPS